MLNSFNVGKPNPLFIFFISIFSFAHEVSEGNRVCPKEGREECLETKFVPSHFKLPYLRHFQVPSRGAEKWLGK